MKTIIKLNNKEHHIQSYKFKNLSLFEDKEENNIEEVKILATEDTKIEQEDNIETQNNTINEEFLTKIDELSSNVIKLQMKLEKQEEEFSKRLSSELEVARKNAYEEGLNAAKEQNENKINELNISISSSIKKLQDKCNELSEFIKKCENDLNEAACLIAKEVVNKELNDNSSKIALNYAKSIMQDIDKNIKIKISVNPKDFDLLNKELSSNKIEVNPDEAINKGCLIINSDTLNTQISIKDRLNQARSMVLDEG